MSGRLAGKVAIVTGASRGLGRRISELLVEEGACVGLVARASDDLTAAAAALGVRALALPADLSDPEAVRAAFARVGEHFGGVDILVNNAALGHPQKIAEADDRLLQLEVAANVLGPIYCIREATRSMRTRGGGDVVNISSESVCAPYPYLSVYAATKSALETLSQGLREELRADGIRVGVLRSGRLSESGFHRSWSPETRERFRAEARASGHDASSGEAISPLITARAVLDMLCLPREARLTMMELRPA
ncbi:MAG: SDR family oxidoreductase [Pseudomonas sp.]|uniref:SDR family oxidoreductase n=1 Tax=Pseudomonas sp. TaxID=306 RepID=UPI0039829E60